jgi:uridine phosphorylase
MSSKTVTCSRSGSMSDPEAHHGAALLPLAEFDPDQSAMIMPSAHFGAEQPFDVDMPRVAVACFFGDAVSRISLERDARVITHLVAEHGRHPVYETTYRHRRLAFYQPGLGAPLAAAFLEELIDYGARTVVACGGAGALVPSLSLGQIVVVDEALRDEGTSFHYLPASRSLRADRQVVSILEQAVTDSRTAHVTGKTWTTDAPYRETAAKVARRREEGCVTVEMEASALMAVAQFRGVRFGQFLYAADSLAGEAWDHRDWLGAHAVREQLFWLAADAALAVDSKVWPA